ncbi:hypothetical protein BCR42DRAFT_377640 [Absidia repens]|uniref:Homeobox domain-containing protein n=1 Tax=Absidia repens TaxID=90262 RepID=A0A1X2IEL3_9FUNG|nr:hypothetical protein BCR42DRAFT_377640 [Absidia repens]
MNSTFTSKLNSASRHFSPLILYHKYDSLNYPSHQNKQHCQPHNTDIEARICQHLAKTSAMLERNADLWADQESITYATLSDVTTSHKKGFASVALTNETPTDQNENHINDITPSSSTSSTRSSSSSGSTDSNSTTRIATPVCPAKTIPMSTLVNSPPYTSSSASSPIITPLEPKTNNMPPPPLYQSNYYSMTNFHQRQGDYQHYRQSQSPSLRDAKEQPSDAAKSVSYMLYSHNPSPSGLIAPSTSSPHYARSGMKRGVSNYYNKNPRARHISPTSPSPSSSSLSLSLSPPQPSRFAQPHRKKEMDSGLKKRRRGNLPKHVTEFLKYWLLQHKEHPYPTERQKFELAQRTDLAVNQISNWFINARRRILHPMLETEQQQQQQQRLLAHQYQYPQHQYTSINQSSPPSSSFGDQDQPHYHQYTTSSTDIELLGKNEDKHPRDDTYAHHGHTTGKKKRWDHIM